MINFRSILKLSAVAVVAFVMTGCADNDALLASKGNMLPDNAVWAVKVNADQLWNKALGEPGAPARDMWQAGKSMASMYTSEFGEFGDVLRQILADPAALGVNMKEPLVLSCAGEISEMTDYDMEGNVEMCLVALLDNSEAFLKVADAAVTFAKAEADVVVFKDVEQEGYTHYEFVAEEGVSVDLGVTAESAVLRFKFDSTAAAAQGLSGSMLALFAGEGPQDVDGLEAFYASAADVASWGDFDAMMNLAMPVLKQEDSNVAAQFEQYLSMYAGSSVVSDLDFQDGKTVLNVGVYGSEELEAYADKYNKKASDKFFKQLPEPAFVAFNVAIKDFAGIVDEMCRINPDYVELLAYLEEEYDFNKELLNGFPGLVTFALTGAGLYSDVPAFGLMMECDESVWEYAQEYLAEYAEADENGVYNIGEMVYVGYTDGYIYAKDAETFNGLNSSSFADNAYAKTIAKGGAVIDLEALPSDILDDFASEINYYMKGEGLLQYVTSVVVDPADDFMSATVTVNMGDKNHNLLEKLVLEVVNSML